MPSGPLVDMFNESRHANMKELCFNAADDEPGTAEQCFTNN